MSGIEQQPIAVIIIKSALKKKVFSQLQVKSFFYFALQELERNLLAV